MATELYLPAKPSLYPSQPFQYCTTWTRLRDKSGQISGAVPDQWHPFPGQGSKNHLALFTVGNLITGYRVDNFKEKVSFADMVTAEGRTIDSSAQPHFGHTIVVVNPATPDTAYFLHNCDGHIVGAQKHTFNPAFPDCSCIHVSCQTQNLNGYSNYAINPVFYYFGNGLALIPDNPVDDSLNIHSPQGL